MLGGRQRLLEKIALLEKEIDYLEDQLGDRTNFILKSMDELNKRLSIVENTPQIQDPVDKYAQLRNENGFFDYQAYKAKKQGLGGR